METRKQKSEKFTQSITFKAFIVGILILVLLIPSVMIQNLIQERQYRSMETISKINDKWSQAQTFCGPVLCIPYETSHFDANDKLISGQHILYVTPEKLDIKGIVFPEKRHYGIFKAILYKSEMDISGSFGSIDFSKTDAKNIFWDKAYLTIGVSDLRGVTNHLDFNFNNQSYSAEAAGVSDYLMGKKLIIQLNKETLQPQSSYAFQCKLNLNGSSQINFIPVGKTTLVDISGEWNDPGFIGNFSPEHSLDGNHFDAHWNILDFNRNIPDTWIDSEIDSFDGTSFGVNLVDTVDHYQQNMRSAKYALMFIALTFVVFFFVEVLTKKRIHPVQYLLVGIALILFYSLLLSISEQIGFTLAYLIASMATIGLITVYAQSIFKNKKQSAILASVLATLYLFLYCILQLEDAALLIGSIGLFFILGLIMFFSRKINWYKPEETDQDTIDSI